jgi:hypothetical protein
VPLWARRDTTTEASTLEPVRILPADRTTEEEVSTRDLPTIHRTTTFATDRLLDKHQTAMGDLPNLIGPDLPLYLKPSLLTRTTAATTTTTTPYHLSIRRNNVQLRCLLPKRTLNRLLPPPALPGDRMKETILEIRNGSRGNLSLDLPISSSRIRLKEVVCHPDATKYTLPLAETGQLPTLVVSPLLRIEDRLIILLPPTEALHPRSNDFRSPTRRQTSRRTLLGLPQLALSCQLHLSRPVFHLLRSSPVFQLEYRSRSLLTLSQTLTPSPLLLLLGRLRPFLLLLRLLRAPPPIDLPIPALPSSSLSALLEPKRTLQTLLKSPLSNHQTSFSATSSPSIDQLSRRSIRPPRTSIPRSSNRLIRSCRQLSSAPSRCRPSLRP